MRILVVGGSGYIGFDLCKALKTVGYDVTVLDVRNDRVPQLISNDIRLLVGSVTTVDRRPDLMKIFDVVINLTGGLDDAALTGLGASAMSQVCAPLYLRDVCEKARIIHISTQYVYSTPEMNKERSSPAPMCDYGRVHVMAENAIISDENSVVLRFGTVWGKSVFTRFDTWGNHFFKLMAEEQPVDLYYPDCMICMLSLHNAIRAVLWAVSSDPGTYNLADRISTREEIAKDILGEYPYTNRPFSSGRFSIGMDCNRIARKGFELEDYSLGFTPC